MNNHTHNSEKGQAIVYLVLGLVVFFGFVALAIDGGMALAERRHAQNAADASSLAGGGQAAAYLDNHNNVNEFWSCADGRVNVAEVIAKDTAKSRAAKNGYEIKYSGSSNYVSTSCTQYSYGDYIDIFLYATVDISDTTPSNFLQIVYPSALHNEVKAVTQIHPIAPFGYGNAIVSLNPAACGGSNGTTFAGTGDSTINGGGVFSNGCLNGDGQPSVEVTGGYGFNYVSEWEPGNTDWNPDTATTVPQHLPRQAYTLDPPTCTTWYQEKDIKALAPNLPSGLYCFKTKVNFGGYDLIGTDITFYTEADMVFNGNSKYTLSAPTSGSMEGVLIYAKNPLGSCTTQSILMNGTSGSEFSGIIYAPCAEVNLAGTGDLIAFNSQIIGWNVKVTGTALVNVTYNRDDTKTLPTTLDLYR